MRILWIGAWLCGAETAQAGWLDDLYVDFGTYNQSDFSGTDGWVSGYSDDPWSAADRDYVYAQTDDGDGTWGEGGPIDNHLTLSGHEWGDFRFATDTIAVENDAFGVVFRYTDAANFYLAFVVGEEMQGFSAARYPAEGEGGDATSAEWSLHLYSVVDGFATEIGVADLPLSDVPERRRMLIDAFGSEIDVYYDVTGLTGVEPSDLMLSVSDEDHDHGTVGVYCYNSGNSQAQCGFDELQVLLRDLDDDSILDGEDDDADGDNWPADEDCDDWNASIHPGADDDFGNGIDEDCDGQDGDGTDTGDTSDTSDTSDTADTSDTSDTSDTADTSDTSDTSDSAVEGPVRWDEEDLTGGFAGCGCATPGVPATWASGLLLALVSAYSRRRR